MKLYVELIHDDESPHACVHKNGMLHPWEDDWCSYGWEKDHE